MSPVILRKCRGVPKKGIACGRELPSTHDYFPKCGKYLRNTCKQCTNEAFKRLPCSTPEAQKKRRALYDWAKAYPERKRVADARYYMRTHGRKSTKIEYQYSVTLSEYLDMKTAQGGLCKLCSKPETRRPSGGSKTVRELSIDHCHVTGRIRGLLCAGCNTMVGWLEKQGPVSTREKIERLRVYLEIIDNVGSDTEKLSAKSPSVDRCCVLPWNEEHRGVSADGRRQDLDLA